MDKEKYIRPAVESTDVEIGVYGVYDDCGPGFHPDQFGQCVPDAAP